MVALSIVIPVYNSEPTLKELASRITGHLEAESFEVILVNDHSKDQSWKVIEALSEQDSRFVGINFRKNVGQDNAIMAGLRYSRGEYVVVMDDDLQHSPSDIKHLRAKCDEGYEVCYAAFDKKYHAGWKKFGSWVNGKIAEWLLKKPKGIYLSPFHIIKRTTVQEVIRYRGPFPYVPGLVLGATDKISQTTVDHHPRYAGTSTFDFGRSMDVFLRMATGHSVIPLRMVAVLGGVSALLGVVLSIYFVAIHLASDRTVEGWTTLMLVNLIIGGMMLVSLGLIGEYVGRVLLTVSEIQQYSIANIVDRREPQARTEEPAIA